LKLACSGDCGAINFMAPQSPEDQLWQSVDGVSSDMASMKNIPLLFSYCYKQALLALWKN